MATILNITYIPATDSIQSVASLEHNGKTLHVVVNLNNEQSESLTDFRNISESEIFQTALTIAMNNKINELENPKEVL